VDGGCDGDVGGGDGGDAVGGGGGVWRGFVRGGRVGELAA